MLGSRIAFLALLLLLTGCGPGEDQDLVKVEDYQVLLDTSQWQTTAEIQSEIAFWSARLRPDSSGLGELGPLAAAYSRLYDFQGDYQHLVATENLLRKAVSVAAVDRSSYVRALSSNLIKQHRFTDALNNLLDNTTPESLELADHYILFDCYLEIGNSELAKEHLDHATDPSDLAYLIRLARYLDHEGDLSAAIRQLERASEIAKSRNQKELILWTSSNLADFYTHDGRLSEAYKLYLESLTLRPDHFHSWQGIAWLAYSVDDEPQIARTILEELGKVNDSPGIVYDLLELALYQGDQAKIESLQMAFIEQSSKQVHGNLYNIPLAYELLDSDPETSGKLVQAEMLQRNSLETRVLNATVKARLGKADQDDALLNDLLNGATEPLTLYHAARLYAALGQAEAVDQLKQALEGTAVELGPYKTEVLAQL